MLPKDTCVALACAPKAKLEIKGESDETFVRSHSSIRVQTAMWLLWVRFRKNPAVAAAGQ